MNSKHNELKRTFVVNRCIQAKLCLRGSVSSTFSRQQPCPLECFDELGISLCRLRVSDVIGEQIRDIGFAIEVGKHVQVLSQCSQEQSTVLRYQRKATSQSLEADLGDIVSVNRDGTTLKFDKPEPTLRQCLNEKQWRF